MAIITERTEIKGLLHKLATAPGIDFHLTGEKFFFPEMMVHSQTKSFEFFVETSKELEAFLNDNNFTEIGIFPSIGYFHANSGSNGVQLLPRARHFRSSDDPNILVSVLSHKDFEKKFLAQLVLKLMMTAFPETVGGKAGVFPSANNENVFPTNHAWVTAVQLMNEIGLFDESASAENSVSQEDIESLKHKAALFDFSCNNRFTQDADGDWFWVDEEGKKLSQTGSTTFQGIVEVAYETQMTKQLKEQQANHSSTSPSAC